jgi:hypothetical protein
VGQNENQDSIKLKRFNLGFSISLQFSSLHKALDECMITNGFDETEGFAFFDLKWSRKHPHGHGSLLFALDLTYHINKILYLGAGLGQSAGARIWGYQEQEYSGMTVQIKQRIWYNSWVAGITSSKPKFSFEAGPVLYLSTVQCDPSVYDGSQIIELTIPGSSTFKIGFNIGGTFRMLNHKGFYLDGNLCYFYVGQLKIDRFTYSYLYKYIPDYREEYDFRDCTVNFSNFIFGLEAGVKF